MRIFFLEENAILKCLNTHGLYGGGGVIITQLAAWGFNKVCSQLAACSLGMD